MPIRILFVLLALLLVATGALYVLGSGRLGEHWGPGVVTPAALPRDVVAARDDAQRDAATAAGAPAAKRILFGDLHVHSTYSTDAFLTSVSLAGGDGAHPIADACDFARYCAGIDFWSINDHALALTPRRWDETIESIRQCNAVAGDDASPDVTAFLGWEWTQMGTSAANHYGHKNVVLRHTDADRIPTRPIAATTPPGARDRNVRSGVSTLALGLVPVLQRRREALDLVRYFQELRAVPNCPDNVPVRELPSDCREQAATPGELFEKLDDWGTEALVIPHGTTWGFYTPLGSSWDKQLDAAQHDPRRQSLVEVFSGHGNSEEYRAWREVRFGGDGDRACPEPTPDYLPSCWRAGQIIRERCERAGEPGNVCDARAAQARQNYLAADIAGHLTVPGATPGEWLDSGQCRDCFLPSFNYRARSSVQYILALRSFERARDPLRFRFGFIASSDTHFARPGTGYKEFARVDMTESRFLELGRGLLARGVPVRDPAPQSVAFDPSKSRAQFFALRETERSSSFFVTGGLVAAHATGRDRDAIWDALARREVYATSGPRILLWFDLLNAPHGERHPMGAEISMRSDPIFEVRAVGSREQRPGCPEYSLRALSPERLDRLCRGECDNPSDQRRRIARIEVVRIRPRAVPAEPVDALVEDPWRVLPCAPDPAGCRVEFSDPEFAAAGRDALYYARAIEEPSLAVNAANLRCEFDENGRCLRTRPCVDVPATDECLAENEERAWSSPIFVDFDPAGPPRAEP
jgi:hypothetical protein